VPTVFGDDTDLNAKMIDAKGDFSVPEVVEKDKPSPEQVQENKNKWSFAD